MGLLNCALHSFVPIRLRRPAILIMVFFLAWPFESKFFFIFGCLIAIVLPTAGLIRARNTLRTTRHTLLMDEERAERTVMTQVVVGEDIAFGISAIEEDEEVEGLWNSKKSTPLHTPLPSPTNSIRDRNPIRSALTKISNSRRASSVSSTSRSDLGDYNARKASQNHNVYAVKQHRTASLDSAIPGTPTQRSQSLTIHHNQMAHVPSRSYAKSDDTPSQPVRIVEQISSTSNLYITPTPPPKKTRRFVIGGCSGSTYKQDEEEGLVSTPHVLEALDRMEAHRRFHAAESGQLLPRSRRMIKSSASLSSSQDTIMAENRQPNSLRSISWPVANKEVIINMTVPHGKPQRRVSPAAIPLSAFVEMHPPSKACPSAWTDRTQELVNDRLEAQSNLTTYTITGSSRGRSVSASSATTVSEPSLRSENSSVLQIPSWKGNTTVEFASVPVLEHENLNHDPRNANTEQLGRKKRPNKLQKRDRSRIRRNTSSADTTTYHHGILHNATNGIV